MNTTEMADRLGTTARQLRMFLRSSASTFVAVGSGGRYEFTDTEVSILEPKFAAWKGVGDKSRTTTKPPKAPKLPMPTMTEAEARAERARRDQELWDEEEALNGPVVLPDITNPTILARVRQAEADRVERLETMLMAAGLHITQMRKKVKR